MIKKMPIDEFVGGLQSALKRKDGYIMGSRGQDPSKWSKDSWWFTQYSGEQKKKALYWRENAQRVWDCNGMAEGLYEDYSGVNINTKARFNYAEWCSPKGEGLIPAEKRTPGAAVFIHSKSKGYITHVGYLVEPVEVGNQSGDWYVIEARGVMYGVVKTRLYDRGWNRWGYMTKYFDYDEIPSQTSDATLRRGDSGDAVKELQMVLITAGYSCGTYGADGDFGAATERAVKAFQADHDLTADGIVGEKTQDALDALTVEDGETDKPDAAEVTYTVTGGSVYIRDAPCVAGSRILGIVHAGDKLTGTGLSDGAWKQIRVGDDNQLAWISGKYVA